MTINKLKDKNMRKLAISVALATLFATAGTVNAATYNIGDLTSLGSDGYSGAASFLAGSNSIGDVFNFSLSGGSNDFSSFISKLSLKPSQFVTSFAGTLTGPGSFSQPLAYGIGVLGGATIQALGWDGSLASGSYSLAINGSSSQAGAYTVQLIAAAVPEPESYALLLAGLGLMGTVARRRSQKQG